jgi:hypothetical protein
MTRSESDPTPPPSPIAPIPGPANEERGEVGRETVRLTGTGSIKFARNAIMRNDPVRPSQTRAIPGCSCPACGRPAAIHGGIASDYLYQVVLAEIGTRGVEIVCEGCLHRYIFGAATPGRNAGLGDETPVEPV